MNFSRRDVVKLALAAPLSAAFAKIDSKIHGVMIGAQSYSFRDRSLDEAIKGYQEVGLGYCELWQGHLQPKGKEEARKWMENPPLDEIRSVRKKFDEAGVNLYAYNYSFRKDFTDQQIQNGFEMAKALGVNKITASSNPSMAKRIDKYAQKYKIYVGMHNHDSMKPDEFSTPKDFEEAMNGNSKYIGINLDIGHFTAANLDPVEYLEKMHDRILTLHLKDRKHNHGENVPFGSGETKIREVLQVLKNKKYPIPAMIEYEYGKPGMDSVAEVKKAYEYCKQVLA